MEEIKIIIDIIDNLTVCEEYYSAIYGNIWATSHQYLQENPSHLIEKMEETSTLDLYSFIDLKYEYNTKEVMHTSDTFFLAFGTFPAGYYCSNWTCA